MNFVRRIGLPVDYVDENLQHFNLSPTSIQRLSNVPVNEDLAWMVWAIPKSYVNNRVIKACMGTYGLVIRINNPLSNPQGLFNWISYQMCMPEAVQTASRTTVVKNEYLTDMTWEIVVSLNRRPQYRRQTMIALIVGPSRGIPWVLLPH